jgi:hypothetical protein
MFVIGCLGDAISRADKTVMYLPHWAVSTLVSIAVLFSLQKTWPDITELLEPR